MAKLEELMGNEEFIEKLRKVETEEDFKELFKDCDFSEFAEEELDEDKLDAIAGGCISPSPHSQIWHILQGGTSHNSISSNSKILHAAKLLRDKLQGCR